MEQNFYRFVGIDVSCRKLDIAFKTGGVWVRHQIVNDWATVQVFANELAATQTNCCCIVEYTGTYSTKIVLALHRAGVKVSLITPSQSNAFAKMKHKTTKNDRQDAQLLAEYGEFNAADLRFHEPVDEKQVQFKQLLDAIAQVETMRQQVRNQRHAYEQLPPDHQQEIILNTYKDSEKQFDKQIDELEKKVKELDNHDEDLTQTKELIMTIVGIGEKTANTILAKTGGIKRFGNHKQLAKFAGTAPTEQSSGSSVRGRRGINRSGNGTLRKAIYCATWSAVKSNKACKALYNRLRAAGKPTKLALIAVANLLLRQIFAVVNTQKRFDNEFHLKNCSPT